MGQLLCKIKRQQESEKGFKSCIRDCIKSVAKCMNLGDQVIYWLRLQKKPAHKPFEEFLNRCTKILEYRKDNWLCHHLEVHNNEEICEQVFLAQPKSHQTKYAETHNKVKTEMSKLQHFFEGCHDADVHSSKIKCIIEKKSKDENKNKKNRHPSNKSDCSDCSDHQDQNYNCRDQYYNPDKQHDDDDYCQSN